MSATSSVRPGFIEPGPDLAILRHLEVPGAPAGPLFGLRFVVKDVLDVQDAPTTAGSPAWAATHTPPLRHAPIVATLLDAGATLVGKAASDELAFSVNGTNPHYGMPPNPAAPGHIPGGSSSGSASAVAAGQVEFALGTDTGGSVRVPASYCGLFGIRPSCDSTDLTGVVPLAPSFDTVGWFARDAATLQRVGTAVLPASAAHGPTSLTLVPVAEALELARDDVSEAVLDRLAVLFGDRVTAPRTLGVDLRDWAAVRYLIQTFETWQAHGAWAQPHLAELGSGVRGRLEACALTTADQYTEACRRRDRIREQLAKSVADGEVLCLPTTPTPAPAVQELAELTEGRRAEVFALGAIAGLWGGPEISVPGATVDGLPIGASLLGRPGADRRLLSFLAQHLPPAPAHPTDPRKT